MTTALLFAVIALLALTFWQQVQLDRLNAYMEEIAEAHNELVTTILDSINKGE